MYSNYCCGVFLYIYAFYLPCKRDFLDPPKMSLLSLPALLTALPLALQNLNAAASKYLSKSICWIELQSFVYKNMSALLSLSSKSGHVYLKMF